MSISKSKAKCSVRDGAHRDKVRPCHELAIVKRDSVECVHTLTRRPVLIGRSSDCDVVVHDPAASRYHAQLITRDGHYYLVDLGGSSGTTLNGRRVPCGITPVHEGDLIGIHFVHLLLRRTAASWVEPASDKTEFTNRSTKRQRTSNRIPDEVASDVVNQKPTTEDDDPSWWSQSPNLCVSIPHRLRRWLGEFTERSPQTEQ